MSALAMLTLLIVTLKVSLALIFIMASVGKLLDLPGSRRALREFGIPASLAAPLGIALPVAELGVALALFPAATAKWGAACAAALLVCFIIGIAINLLILGRKPDCHCFGQLHSAPAGWGTLIRDTALACAAGLVFWQQDRVDLSSLSSFGAAESLGLLLGFATLAVIAGQSWFMVHLLRQHGRILLRLDALETAYNRTGPFHPQGESRGTLVGGLPLGVAAPSFSLPDHRGHLVTLDTLRAVGTPVILIFSDPNCTACAALMPEIRVWQRERSAELTIAVIDRTSVNKGAASETPKYDLTTVLLQKDREVAQAYEVAGTPSAVIVRPDGTIGSALATGPRAIRDLVALAAGLPKRPTIVLSPGGNGHSYGQHDTRTLFQAKLGEPAPRLKLPDLAGRPRDLMDFRGAETLVLFWNPGCRFCQQMLGELKGWEENPPVDAPKIVIISSGSTDANKKMGLLSPILLDENFAAGRAFGVTGTPSGVILDENGRIASTVAVGAQAIRALTSGPLEAAAS